MSETAELRETAREIDPRYPVGRFKRPEKVTSPKRVAAIVALAELPGNLKHAVEGLDREQLDTPYREGGWTVRQLIHHIPDSHINAYVRFKLALTETDPVVKTYEEQLWAEMEDSRETPVEVSLTMLEALHTRWVVLLRTMKDEAFARRFVHPQLGPMALEKVLAMYAWHGAHHTAHVTELRKRMKW